MIFGDIISVLEFLSEIAVCFLLASRGSELRALPGIAHIDSRMIPWLCAAALSPAAFFNFNRPVLPVTALALAAFFSAFLLTVIYKHTAVKAAVFSMVYWGAAGLCQLFFYWLSVSTHIAYTGVYSEDIAVYGNYHTIFQMLFAAMLWYVYIVCCWRC